MNTLMATMMDRMMVKMSKEDIQATMAAMMNQMFAGMSSADKVSFMQEMIGVCIPKITEGLGTAEREYLGATLLTKMSYEINPAAGE